MSYARVGLGRSIRSAAVHESICRKDIDMNTRPRKAATSFLMTMLLCASCLLMTGWHAEVGAQQQPSGAASTERASGISLYKQGDFKGAIKALRAAIKQNKD